MIARIRAPVVDAARLNRTNNHGNHMGDAPLHWLGGGTAPWPSASLEHLLVLAELLQLEVTHVTPRISHIAWGGFDLLIGRKGF